MVLLKLHMFSTTNFVMSPHCFLLVILLCKVVEVPSFSTHLHEAYIKCIIYTNYSIRFVKAHISLCKYVVLFALSSIEIQDGKGEVGTY